MLRSGWLKQRFVPRARPSRKTHRWLPRLAEIETLEERCLLATFLVANLNDSGAGSLRQAVTTANQNGNPGEIDNIRFDQELLNTSRVISLTSGQIPITQSVYILGPTFDPAGIVVSGNGSSRVFNIASSAQNVTLQFFTVTRGSTSGDGGGLLNAGSDTVVADMVFSANQANFGGGISNIGGLGIQRSQIISNSASSDGGGIDNFTGGRLTINNTTIADNVADEGGGIVNESVGLEVTITNSTISNNTAASGSGGGVLNSATTSSAFTIQNSTIVGNVSMSSGGGISSSAGDVMVMNVTIAKNIDFDSNSSSGAGGVSRTGGGTVTGINLVVAQNQSTSGNNDLNPGALNGPGTQANFISGNPGLGPLQDNGGPTFTMAPLPGSPVLGNGTSSGATMLDQRGFARSVSASGGTPSVDQGAVEFFPTLTQPYAVTPGTHQGDLRTRAFNSNGGNGRSRFDRQPFGPTGIETRVALGDINNDGTKDIISTAGPGGGSRVLVQNGLDPSQILRDFFVYPGFFGGVFVASGDINGDGVADIITGAGAGGLAHVRIISGSNLALLADVFPFGAFFGGVHVASGDINNDGRADLIVAAGAGGGPHVKVYNGNTVLANPNDSSLLSSFFAYPGFLGGVFVASGDVNGDGVDDIITGPGAGGGPHVKVFNQAGAMIDDLFAFAANFQGGVRVGAVDANGDGFMDIIAGAGPGGGPHVRIFDSLILTTFGAGTELAGFFAFEPFFNGGIFVAGSKVSPSGGSPLQLAEGDFDLAGDGTARFLAEDLARLSAAAIDRFDAAGVSAAGIAVLENAIVELAELEGNLLALTFGNHILVDADAAGAGFFVDATPGDDIEFQTATGQAIAQEARDRVDLLTVLAHELAHVLGLEDIAADEHPRHLLADRLAPGVRRFVDQEALAALDEAFLDENFATLLAD